MNHEQLKHAYRFRLDVGDVVYFVEGENDLGDVFNEPLVVKKGTVERTSSTEDPNDHDLLYPIIALEGDRVQGSPIMKSPREVFTLEEASYLINTELPEKVSKRTIDSVIRNCPDDERVVGILGGATIYRMADDLFSHPNNPEA